MDSSIHCFIIPRLYGGRQVTSLQKTSSQQEIPEDQILCSDFIPNPGTWMNVFLSIFFPWCWSYQIKFERQIRLTERILFFEPILNFHQTVSNEKDFLKGRFEGGSGNSRFLPKFQQDALFSARQSRASRKGRRAAISQKKNLNPPQRHGWVADVQSLAHVVRQF